MMRMPSKSGIVHCVGCLLARQRRPHHTRHERSGLSVNGSAFFFFSLFCSASSVRRLCNLVSSQVWASPVMKQANACRPPPCGGHASSLSCVNWWPARSRLGRRHPRHRQQLRGNVHRHGRRHRGAAAPISAGCGDAADAAGQPRLDLLPPWLSGGVSGRRRLPSALPDGCTRSRRLCGSRSVDER